MVVQQIQAPEPAPVGIGEQLVEGLGVFIEQYYSLILIVVGLVVGCVIAGIGVYYVLRWRDSRKDRFEKAFKNSIVMARLQKDNKRVVRWKEPTYIVGLAFAGLSGLLLIMIKGFMGFFMAWLIIPTVLGLTFAVELIFKPFKRGDKVFIRYYEDKRLIEREIGQYRGAYYGNNKFWYLLLSASRRFLIFDSLIIVKVPKNPVRKVKIVKTDSKGVKTESFEEKELGIDFNDIVQFTDQNIYLNNVASIEKIGFYWNPTYIDNVGRIINNSILYFEGDKDNTIIEHLFDITNSFADVQRRAIEMNSAVQFNKATDGESIDQLPKKDESL